MRVSRLPRFEAVVRRIFDVVLVGLVALTVAAAAGSRLAPLVGQQLIIVRSGSMAPAMPTGSLAAIAHDHLDRVGVGDVVTLRLPSGTIVTHRVVRRVTENGQPFLETKGDANPYPDPALSPASWVVGRVDLELPFAGYVMALLSAPTGVLAIILLASTLLVAIKLLEDEREGEREAAVPSTRLRPPHVPRGTAKEPDDPAGAPA